MGFEESFEQDKKEHNIHNDGFFKVEEGDNRMRIVTEPVIWVSVYNPKTGRSMTCYEGAEYCKDDYIKQYKVRKTIRYLTWIWHHKTEQFRLYPIPYTVTQQLVKMKQDVESQTNFDEFPMPYDININAENAGTKDVVYTLTASRKESELPEQAKSQMEELQPVENIVSRMKEKAREKIEGEKEIHYPTEEEEGISTADIPF